VHPYPLARALKTRPHPLAIVALIAALVLDIGVTHARSSAHPRERTFYVSPSGHDGAAGTSPSTAWRTLARVNRVPLAPGSRILLRGSGTFDGTLRLNSPDRGTPRNPISIGSYGRGRATIRAPKTAVLIHDTAGVRVAGLRLVAAGPRSASKSGIAAVNDLNGDVKLPFIRIDRVEASDFGDYGVVISGRNGRSGFKHVRISRVVAHDNLLGGIAVIGHFDPSAEGHAHRYVQVRASRAYDNPGVPTMPQHTGDGIMLSNTDHGLIARSTAHDNGRRASGEEGGPIGIWAWDADHVVIRHNSSYRNHVSGRVDGGGFDLDGGVSNSVMEHNRSHGNDGPGFLAVQFAHAPPNTDNVIRGNTSRDDARENGPGAIYVTAGVEDLDVYGNTVSISARRTGPVAAVAVSALPVAGVLPVTSDVRIHDNRFRASGGAAVVDVSGDHPGLVFEDNTYSSLGAPLRILWNGAVYDGVGAWSAATGQETPMAGSADGGSSRAPWVAVGLGITGLAILVALAWRARHRRGAAG
jgi:hypothetical protein